MDVSVERELRKSWDVDSKVEVFSKSKGKWFPAKIIEIYNDEDGEWLAVIVAGTMIKEVQRFNKDVRPLIEEEEPEDSASEDDSSEDSSMAESLDSLSGSDSDSSSSGDGRKKKKKQKKKDKKLLKHAETIVIFVERSGNEECNGKYMYHTSKDGFPVFKKVQNPLGDETTDDVVIWCEEVEEDSDDESFDSSAPLAIWRFSANESSVHLYECDDVKGIPPSSGWRPASGAIPVPGVRLDSLKQEEKESFFVDDPFKFSPFDIFTHEFDVEKDKGFSLKLQALHSRFVVVDKVEDDSQASKFRLEPSDILISINGEDLSQIKSVEQVMKVILEHNSILQAREDGSKLKMKFAREKRQFQVMMVARGGSSVVNGKYTISGEHMGALRYVKNGDSNFIIHRMYVNQEEDESIWALKHLGESRDYYIMLASAKDHLPPECGWQAVDPAGLWPAPGLTYYDVDIQPPPVPEIVSVEPNPGAVQIKWTCEEPRKPPVCPNMDVWYEIECRHLSKDSFDVGFLDRKKKPTASRVKFAIGGGAGSDGDMDESESLNSEDEKEDSSRGPPGAAATSADISRTLKTIKCDSSPFVFNKLVNGEDYVFTVRTCNQISSSQSEASKAVTPLKLPPKPVIRNIKGYPGELMVIFTCPRAGDRDVQATFEVIVTPPIPAAGQFHKMEDGKIVVEDDGLPIRLRGLTNGLEYKIIVAATNTVGITYSEPEVAYPSKLPPQPKLISVESENRQLKVSFECPGYDDPDIRAWFEVDIDPPPPQIMSAAAKKALIQASVAEEDGEIEFTYTDSDDDKKEDPPPPITPSGELSEVSSPTSTRSRSSGKRGHNRGKSSRTLGARKQSRWRRDILGDNDDEDYVPPFRAEKRYLQSPIKLYPLNNGQPYTVRVKATTLSGVKVTDFWDPPVIPLGPPPMPKIVKVVPKSQSAKVFFECDDYATPDYKAKYEIESKPLSIETKDFDGSPVVCKSLRDGVAYTFRVRGYNSEGKSKWSDESKTVTPLTKPPAPINLQCVAFDGEVTVFWVCEELNQMHYQGWYEVLSDPPTLAMVVSRQQARIRRLKNGQSYRFKVVAVNEVGRMESKWSDPVSPTDTVMKAAYNREKKRIACVMKEQLLEERKKRAKEESSARVAEFEVKRREVMHLEEQKARKDMQKKLKRKKKKEEERKQREAKKAAEQKARKQKMEEQRAKVLAQKRRISMIQRERIDVLQKQWGTRGGATASAMVSASKKKAAGRGAFASATAPRRKAAPIGGTKKKVGKKKTAGSGSASAAASASSSKSSTSPKKKKKKTGSDSATKKGRKVKKSVVESQMD